jgi:HD superfamily phosphohydrolase/tRNA A-37 threonylcarbamoyl transferase component Bud32
MADLFNESSPATEKNNFPEYLHVVSARLSKQYDFITEKKAGKTGQTYVIRDRESAVQYCLKTISPSVRGDDEREMVRATLRKECEILRPLEHRCVPRIYTADLDADLPYYVCTFHPGKTWEEFRRTGRKLQVSEASHIIFSLIDAIKYLHESGRTHCDLHLENLMLSERIHAEGIMIIDLGSGHRHSAIGDSTLNRGHLAFKPMEALPKNRNKVNRKENWDEFTAADMKALGSACAQMDAAFFGLASHEQRVAYRTFSKGLQDGEFRNWDEIAEHFHNVVDPHMLFTRTEKYLRMPTGERDTVLLPASGPVPVGEAVLAVVNTDCFQRLRSVRQLSFCDWFFPGGTHTRFEHSLGVFKTAYDAVGHLVNDHVFRSRFNQRNIDALLLASLLHDVGHYPYAHVIEHYVSSRLPKDGATKSRIHHYNYSLQLIREDNELAAMIDKHWGANISEEAVRILEKKVKPLSDLLDGPVDCDKLDYLRRDAHHCGVTFGLGVDVNGVLGALRCSPDASVKDMLIDVRGLQAVEGFVVLQGQMLSAVYWNENIRALFAMFHAYLAHTVGRDVERLVKLVEDIRRHGGDIEAINRVFASLVPSRKSLDSGVTAEQLKELITLHAKPTFKPMYRPIARYAENEDIDAKSSASDNVYRTIFSSPQEEQRTGMPIRWEKVRRLRQAFAAAIKEKAIPVSPIDVLVDVPWGKDKAEEVRVLDENGIPQRISDVSHLKAERFTSPAAFSAPVRIYASPRIVDAVTRSLGSIKSSAEEKFHDRTFLPEESPAD